MRAKDTLGLSRALSYTKHEMRQRMNEALEEVGLTVAQYGALAELEERGRLTNAELARACYVTPQTMIRISRDLRQRGFLKPFHHEDHGSKIDFVLTAKAEKVLCDAHTLVDRLEREMVSGMSRKQVADLMVWLSLISENLS